MPSISLLNEYIQEIKKLNENVKISSMPFLNNELVYVYVVTQERLIEFEFNENDLLIIDEAYELYQENQRSAIATNIINKALKNNCFIKLFYPCISNTKLLIRNLNENYEFDEYYFFDTHCSRVVTKYKRNISFNLIIKPNEKTAFFAYKHNHFKLAEKLDKEFKNINFTNEENRLINLLTKIYTVNYKPIAYLKKGIVISNGDMPKLYRFIAENIFKNSKNVNLIICNNTISKGVNLKIKNIIIYDKASYKSKIIDDFEIKNLMGRTGRYTDNIDDAIGRVTVISNESKLFDDIKKLNSDYSINSSSYIKNYEITSKGNPNFEKEKEIFKNNISNIKNGQLNINEFIFHGESKNIDNIVSRNKNTIINFYNKKSDSNKKFYDFIINLYGGKVKFIERFFSTKRQNDFYDRLKNSKELIDFYYKHTFKCFKIIFENVHINNVVTNDIKYYIKNNYFIKKEPMWNITKKDKIKNGKENKFEKISEKNYSNLFTCTINKLLKDISNFYESSFMMFEYSLKNKFKEEIIENKNELDIIIDKYSLPTEIKQLLLLEKINNIEEFKKSKIFKIFKENEILK